MRIRIISKYNDENEVFGDSFIYLITVKPGNTLIWKKPI